MSAPDDFEVDPELDLDDEQIEAELDAEEAAEAEPPVRLLDVVIGWLWTLTHRGDDELDEDDTEQGGDVVEGPWPRRAEREAPGVDLVKAEPPAPPAPVHLPAVLKAAAAHRIPSRSRAVAVVREYGPALGWVALWSPVRGPWWLLKQLGPVGRGLGVLLDWRAEWIGQPEARAAAKAEGVDPNKRADLTDRIEARASARRKLWLIMVAAALLVVAVGLWYAPLLVLLAGLGVLVWLDVIGRRPDGPVDPTAPPPPSPIRPGMTLGSMVDSIIAAALVLGFELRVQEPRPLAEGEGFLMRLHTTDPLEPKTLRALERELGIPKGSMTVVVAADNSAVRELRITLIDPLSFPSRRPTFEVGDLSIRDRLPLGKIATGLTWFEVFLRAHFEVIGKSRSGKSSALWWLVYLFTRCRDCRVYGIDLTGGPAFAGLRGVLVRRAWDRAAALSILTEAKAEAQRRIHELAAVLDGDEAPDDVSENVEPTPDLPQWVILIDEYAEVAADDDLRELVEWLFRYAAKAAIIVGIAGQSSKATDYGTTTIRDQVMVSILLACAREDVLRVLGMDARDEGYRPDLLKPAQGGEARDAGKAYASSAVNADPYCRRWYRFEAPEVRAFARAYRAWRDRQAQHVDVDGTEADAVVIPPALAACSAALTRYKVTRIPSAIVVEHANDAGAVPPWSQATLAEALVEHEVTTTKQRSPLAGGRSVQCYEASDVRAAIGAL